MTRAEKWIGGTVFAVAVAGCGAEGRSSSVPSTSAAASASVLVASEVASSAVAAPAPARPPYDTSKITRLIDGAALASVKKLVVAKQWSDAATALEALAGGASEADRPSLLYLAGLTWTTAGVPKKAAAAFEASGKAGGPLASYAWYAAALRLRDLSEFDAELAALAMVDAAAVPRAKTDPLRAKALVRVGKAEDGFVVYREIVAQHDKSWAATSLELAHALLDHPGGSHAEEAAALALEVTLDGPASREADAKSTLDSALSTMRVEDRKPFEDPSSAELAKRGARLVASGRSKQALAIAQKLEKRKDESCGAVALRARALAGVGRASEASTAFETAITACAGDATMDGARLLFDAGRAAAKGGNLPKAITRYMALEEQFPTSSLTDDARIERAKAALENQDDAAFAAALAPIVADYPKGDLTGDGAFLLAITLAKRGDWKGAIAPLTTGAALERERMYYRAGRFEYFRGRALAETGDDAGARGAYARVLADYPLSYYAAMACARSEELEAGACAKALDRASNASEPAMPDDATRAALPFRAAELLTALDDGPMVMVALDALGVGDRSAAPETTTAGALLLARTSTPALGHLLLRSASETEPRAGRNEAVGYRDAFATGAWREVWEAAYPRPFADAVKKASTESGVPEPFLFAVMREESAFDPNAVSKAGALGLTQVMPIVGKRGAKRLGLPDGDADFLDPEENVRLGAHFMKQMRDRFSGDVLLAIPAYNAGPLAPEGWAKDRPGMALDLFVEDMPYTETRNYTKRVIGSLFVYEFLSGAGASGEAARSPRLAVPAP